MAEQDEQLEAFKRWWKKNWPSLALGVALAVLILGGWNYWQNKQAADQAEARQGFDTLVSALSREDMEERRSTLEFALNSLKENHEDNVYAVFAAMAAASYYMEEGEPGAAASELEWAMNRAGEEPLPLVIRERLARAWLAAGEQDKALEVINSVSEPGAFAPLFLELEGDIHRARGDNGQAREAYKAAMEAMGKDVNDRLLDIKLADLAVAEEDE
ncbi:MAG: tetratricopeptide repeat protein [Oleiphilaceae bacterium]|nr:tetratricopeptide repeat protein [Oleiphilaceae bacterium]